MNNSSRTQMTHATTSNNNKITAISGKLSLLELKSIRKTILCLCRICSRRASSTRMSDPSLPLRSSSQRINNLTTLTIDRLCLSSSSSSTISQSLRLRSRSTEAPPKTNRNPLRLKTLLRITKTKHRERQRTLNSRARSTTEQRRRCSLVTSSND